MELAQEVLASCQRLVWWFILVVWLRNRGMYFDKTAGFIIPASGEAVLPGLFVIPVCRYGFDILYPLRLIRRWFGIGCFGTSNFMFLVLVLSLSFLSARFLLYRHFFQPFFIQSPLSCISSSFLYSISPFMYFRSAPFSFSKHLLIDLPTTCHHLSSGLCLFN